MPFIVWFAFEPRLSVENILLEAVYFVSWDKLKNFDIIPCMICVRTPFESWKYIMRSCLIHKLRLIKKLRCHLFYGLCSDLAWALEVYYSKLFISWDIKKFRWHSFYDLSSNIIWRTEIYYTIYYTIQQLLDYDFNKFTAILM